MAKREREAPEMLGMVRRIVVNGMVRRASEGDLEALSALAGMRDAVDEAMAQAVRVLHDEAGYSWADVGRELGMTRQAAQQRFGERAAG